MKQSAWRSVLFWALAPLLAYLFGYFRPMDLALGGVVFITIWLCSDTVAFIAERHPEGPRSVLGCLVLWAFILLSTVVSTAVQLNYFFHWFTLGGGV